jgi:ketosteroid isomerase-like protein
MQATGEFLTQWAAAEQAGDTGTLETLLAAGFTAVGPLGFILPKQARLARHRSRDLSYSDFSLDEIEERPVGPDAVLVTARTNTRGRYQGHPIPEATRATLVLASDAGRWQLAAIHISFIAGTAGAPPTPGPGPGQPQRHGGGA